MKMSDSVLISARRMVVCAVAAFALSVHAGAKGSGQVTTYDATSIKNAQLRELAQKCKGFEAGMAREVSSKISPFRAFVTPPFTMVVDSVRKAAGKYVPMYEALRADVVNLEVAEDSLREKESLLKSIDAKLDELKKSRDMTTEGVLDELTRAMDNKSKKGKSEDARGWSCLGMSILPSLELPNQRSDIYGLRLNVIGGDHFNVAGIDIGGVFNSVDNHMQGIQAAGLCNISKENAGVQFAGLFNFDAHMVGIQCTAFMNLSLVADGCQIADANVALKSRSLQIGGGNYSVMGKGCQLAGWCNLADVFEGFECGVWNNADDIKGVQIGVVNIANTMTGCQIGLCNVIKTSSVPVLPVVNMHF